MHDSAFRLSFSAPMSAVRESSAVAVTSKRVEEVPVQVSIDDEWHRPMLDPRGIRISGTPIETACEIETTYKYSATRDESYEGKLCTRGCFTPGELRRAADYAAVVEKRRVDEIARQDAEREKWFADGQQRRTDRMNALKKPDDKDKP